MWLNLAISAVLAVVVFVLGIRGVHWYENWKWRCPYCREAMVRNLRAESFVDPSPAWLACRCGACSAEFVRVAHDCIRREDWTGDPEAEIVFNETEFELGS